MVGDPAAVVFTRKQQGAFERLYDWLNSVAARNGDARPGPVVASSDATIVTRAKSVDVDDVEVVGESYYRQAFADLFIRAGKPLGGVTWYQAVLVAEPDNPHDENAVAVSVDGHKVGHIPADLAPTIQRDVRAANRRGEQVCVAARIWAACDDATWSARVTLDPTEEPEPEWRYVDEPHWPGRISPDGAERLTDSGSLRQYERYRAALIVHGRAVDDYRPDVAQARADGDPARALAILGECIDAAERAAAIVFAKPDQWPTEQAATIYRGLKDYDAEVAVLERYFAASPDHAGTKGLRTRLTRARELAGKESGTAPASVEESVAASETVVTLAGPRPVIDVALPFAAELSYEIEHIDAIKSVVDEAGGSVGAALYASAFLRERHHRPHGFGYVDVYINRKLVGSVAAIEADAVREIVRRDEYTGHDCCVRCRVFLASIERKSARITLGRYEDVVEREDETESAARTRQQAVELEAMRMERLAAGGQEAADQRRRLVRDKDYIEWVETIKDLKREKRYADALQLALECVDAAERDAVFHQCAPPPAYTEHAAMLYRKLGNANGEVRILERYERACPDDQGSSSIAERLVKARARL
ncbi:hypothetical protein GCM10023197_32740 [Gordonia humi]|uniref:HIRAN domain-containing protein n=1 Tax=Gordonia humi TaxID=686429 RepID=UPI001C8562AC